VGLVGTDSQGGVDGLAVGSSDSEKGEILRLAIDSKVPKFLQRLQVGAGRIEFIPSELLLVVPFTRENKITADDMSDSFKEVAKTAPKPLISPDGCTGNGCAAVFAAPALNPPLRL
jgi:hypothetical protein